MLFYHCINSKIHRIALIFGALGGTIYVVIRDYEQWQDRPVVTSLKVGAGVTFHAFILSLKDSNKQVKGTPFPSVTICTEGINMDAVTDAVTRDFNDWLKLKKNYTYLTATGNNTFTKEEHSNNVKDFLYESFSISPSYNINIEDIALAFSSPDPDK